MPSGARNGRARKSTQKRVTRYDFADVADPRTPETGHTSLLPTDELVVTLPMDNGWTDAVQTSHLPDDDRTVIIDMDPVVDPILFWAGKRTKREIPVLPLQRNEIVSESRIGQIIERARRAAGIEQPQQSSFFAELEKDLRETDKNKRVDFYTHDEQWKNKLICGDSLQVMESLIHYEGLRGRVQMIYIDPPYGIKYDSNFQQRIDSTKNDGKDRADDVLTIKAFRDTWTLGIHSYLSYLQERVYLCRDLLSESGSIFVQISEDHVHQVRMLLDEIFGASNAVSLIAFQKTTSQTSSLLGTVVDYLLWYAKDKSHVRFGRLYAEKTLGEAGSEEYVNVELPSGEVRLIKEDELSEPAKLPQGARVFATDSIVSEGGTAGEGSQDIVTPEGITLRCGPHRHWKVKPSGILNLWDMGRLVKRPGLRIYKRYFDDFPFMPLTNVWLGLRGDPTKLYAVQTSPRVVERCILMTTDPGDLVLDPTCGSGTTALSAEKLGRRWITCDTSRVAVNIARKRLLSNVYDHYRTRDGRVSSGFENRTVSRITLKSLAYNMEPQNVEIFDQPMVERDAVRVTGPFEVMTLGRYSLEDWKGYVTESGKLENYIAVICRLYRKDAAVQGAAGLIHAVAESELEKIAVSVGPISGRVTAKQIHDAVEDALAMGILEVHVLGWAFEANVGEVKSRIESRGRVKVELVVIRPDTMAEGLKATQPEMLFTPLSVPDVGVATAAGEDGAERYEVTLTGVAVFDRKRRTADYHAPDSGYISAWYLDEDYDGDCFVDCQMFFDFARAPNLRGIVSVDPDEFSLKSTSEPFAPGGYRRIAVKVVDVYGNESTVVRDL